MFHIWIILAVLLLFTVIILVVKFYYLGQERKLEFLNNQILVDTDENEPIKGYTIVYIKNRQIIFKGLVNNQYKIKSQKKSRNEITYLCTDTQKHDATILFDIKNNQLHLFLNEGMGYKFF